MRRSLLLAALCTIVLFSQTPLEKKSPALLEAFSKKSSTDPVLVWVFFKDKAVGLNKTAEIASQSVTSRSMERRRKVLPADKLFDQTDLPVSRVYLDKIEAAGFTIRQVSKWFNGASVWVTKNDLSKIVALDCVSNVDLVTRMPKESILPASKPLISPVSSEHINKTTALDYGSSLTQMSLIKVPDVHALGYSGAGVIIAVLDAGFNNLKHEAFANMNIIATHDFVNHITSVNDSTGRMGTGTHGTATLSLIGGYKPGKLIGPAYSAKFILAKTENTDSETPVEEDNWIAGIEWADSLGVDVSSTSLGYLAYDSPYIGYTWQNMDGRTARISVAATMAARKGIFVVNAAGNEGSDPNHNTLGAPADADSILTVGAVDYTGTRASFSSVGNTVDGRTKPDVAAMGVSDFVAGPGSTSYYYYGDGTSFSTPLTAGAAAVILGANPKLTPIQLRDILRNTASNAASPNRLLGWGIINALKAFQTTDTETNNKNIKSFSLYQNYPNPFNPATLIKYDLVQDSKVEISVYAITGAKVSTLVSGLQSKGEHFTSFDGRDFASGVYMYQMSVYDAAGNVLTNEYRKMMLLK